MQNMAEQTKFSIIIPTLNNLSYLIPCLEAIKETCSDLPYEVIVVANAADAQTRSTLPTLDVKPIYLEKNLGFAAACNRGVEQAIGKYVIFLNDDTLPAYQWLHRLHHAFRNAAKTLELDSPIGAVGPSSNAVSGVQRIKVADDPLARNQIAQQAKEGYRLAHTLVGFCLFLPRKLFNDIGGFDAKKFPLGAEDNDLSIRLMQEGYQLLAVRHAYVYHHCSVTMKKFPDVKLGCRDIDILSYKHSVTNNQLCIGYRVKINNDYFLGVFLRSIAKSLTCADHIFILDDKSPIDFKDQLPKDSKITYRRYSRKFNERRDRNELLDFARETGADWFMTLDADEILEDKFDRKYAEKLMKPVNPHTFAYGFHEYTFWNDEEHFLFSDPWGRMTPLRMWRVQPQRSIKYGANSTLHCEQIPVVPEGCMAITSVRILHYGYVRPEDRQTKYEWYEKHDTDKQEALIGFKDYRHLIDESVLKLRKYIPDTSMSIATMSNEDSVTVVEWMWYVGIFADEIVLCDTGMDERTVNYLKYFNVKLVKGDFTTGGFGINRNKALELCTSHWIFQLDLDEKPKDWSALKRGLDLNVDAYLCSVLNLMHNGNTCISETIRIFKRDLSLQYHGLIHETIDDAIKASKARVYRSPTEIIHFGYLLTPDRLKKKMLKYFEMNIKDLMLNNPVGKTYYNLALHFQEVAELDLLTELLLKKAIELTPTFIQPYKELSMMYLKRANALATQVLGASKTGLNAADDMQCKQVIEHTKPFMDSTMYVPPHVVEYLNTHNIQIRSTQDIKDPTLRDMFIFPVDYDRFKNTTKDAEVVGLRNCSRDI